MYDVGIQCSLSGEIPIHVNDTEEVMDDDEFTISDTSSTSDESYCNEGIEQHVIEDDIK